MEIPLDLHRFKLEIASKKLLRMIIENTIFCQESVPVVDFYMNESTILINNIKVFTNEIEIYKKNNEFYLTDRFNHTKVILY
ncbi:hypothetical protein KFD70_06505 [Bacillus pfraonensis]|uniref:hypothetical protein n=1 Tax=Bacillus TaxID=1386 RepID=UPI002A577BCC|nr:hypothetical protein [Bacillus pseudomycoides]